ncbi:MAG TPA: methyltransferase domain-containing protein [Pyrinomonadaceae bacterium]|jgi:SAM-dependent methyltransferase|nr:methyltransferase domain-containing protein [Pyrinomonadaceae bacterium]
MSSVSEASNQIDPDKLHAFIGKVVGDFGAALSSTLVYIGQRLGLYKALAEAGPSTPAELAERTGTVERYVREWLINQATGGYVAYDPASGRFHLPPEQAVALADEESPFYVGGGFYVIKAMSRAEPQITKAFKEGGGLLWGDNDPDLFVGVERFFRPGYMRDLTSSWIPALTGMEEKLKAGGLVADIGCGHGASTIIMAKAYPNSRFRGFDNHAPSIEHARRAAEEAGVGDRCEFEVSPAAEVPGEGYDMVCFFDCLHDMGDPVGAARRACEVLSESGSALIVEPMAGDTIEGNFDPVGIGRTFSAASTLCCTPNSLALGGPALGAVAAEEKLREVVLEGGFKEFRRATETPFNRVFEARK